MDYRKNIVAETYSELIKCKFCGSTNVVRFGTRDGVQRFWCKDCERKFVDNKALPGFRIPTEWIGLKLLCALSFLSALFNRSSSWDTGLCTGP